jgi:hypothetical protein
MSNQKIHYVKYHPKYAINQAELLHQIYRLATEPKLAPVL